MSTKDLEYYRKLLGIQLFKRTGHDGYLVSENFVDGIKIHGECSTIAGAKALAYRIVKQYLRA